MAVIDVGGGASVLVDCLLEEGFQSISVLDIAEAALKKSKQRLVDHGMGQQATDNVNWVVSDVTKFFPVKDNSFAVWHDRAVLHFLTNENDRLAYVEVLNRSLAVGGIVVIAAFAVDGPKKCSGLDVIQYDTDRIVALLGDNYRLLQEATELHHTPFNTDQKFSYFKFVRTK